MNLLDNLIGIFSPQKAYERQAWRQALNTMRGYDAANPGRQNAGWRVFNESAELTDRYSRDVIRARARDLERNSDIAQSVLHAFTRNVVGKGYTLQAKTGDETLNTRIETLWKQWCRAENCDITASQSFQQIIRMAVLRKKVDGGILFVKRYTRDGLIPFKLQMIEVDELDTTAFAPKHKGNTVVGGVERDASRRAVGYFIRQYDAEGWQLTTPAYIDAADVIPYWTKNRPSQMREVSDIAAAVTRIRDANEFMTAVSVKERIAACLAVFIKRTTPASGIGRGMDRQPDGRISYEGKTLTPGMIREMNAGDELQVVDPKNAGSDATQFLKMQWQLIGAGQGLSYEAASRDMSNATYSSARQAANEDEDTFAAEVELLTDVMSRIYETFVLSCYLSGKLDLSEFQTRQSEYMNHMWVKSPKKWIDPLKEANAVKIALLSGQKTYQEVAAEQGRDWMESLSETAEMLKYAEALGLDLGDAVFGKQQKSNTKYTEHGRNFGP